MIIKVRIPCHIASLYYTNDEEKERKSIMSFAINVTDSEFQRKVLDSTIPVVADFWAPWCGPCKVVTPILEKMSVDYAEKVLFIKINADENPNLLDKYGIQGIPTLLFFQNGKLFDRLVGAHPAATILEKVEALLENTRLKIK
jgi:thioredoxin 1